MSRDTRGRGGGPRNVLYLTDDHDECDEVGCMDLLGADAPQAVDVLFVTFTGTARERLATWRRHADAPPANVGVVTVETGGSGTDDPFGAGGPTVRRVSDPSDLTGVGIAISEFLSEWAGNDNRTVVCFDSLTALLQYVDRRRVFQFCNEITSKFETAGVAAHFHIAPEAHDRQVLSVLASLFDDRVSAADLGHATRGGEESDADPPARASDAADPPAAQDERQPAASGGDRAPPEDPAGTDESDESAEGSFVFAGDESGHQATADGDDSSPSGDGWDEPEPSEADEPSGAGDSGGTETPAATERTETPAVSDERGAPSESADTGSPAGASDADASVERRGDDDPATDSGSTGAPGGPAPGPDTGEGASAGSTSEGLIPRTTATVVGVVVMLLLMSFFAAAFPAPLVLEEAGDGVDGATVTPEDAASGADADATTVTPTSMSTATATQGAARTGSPSETTTSTSTPAQGGTPTASSSSSTTSGVPTPTATTEPVSTEPVSTETTTSTPTPTPDDGGILDPIGDTVDDTL